MKSNKIIESEEPGAFWSPVWKNSTTRWVFVALMLQVSFIASAPAGSWTAANPVPTSRSGHTTTLLPNGKILVAGGFDGANVLSSVEIYNPATGGWTTATSMNAAREQHTATLLPNGKVLVAGGIGNPFAFLTSAEVYDPIAGTWTTANSMSTGRSGHTATLMPSGKVLVSAGTSAGGGYTATAELYDPSAGTWSVTGSLNTKRTAHTATLLTNGMVLAAGGTTNGVYLASTELYNPATGLWAASGSLITGREDHTATQLASGKVLVCGGIGTGGALSATELYDPVSGTWSSTGGMVTGRYLHTANLLPNGKALAVGGLNITGVQRTAAVEQYDPNSGTWASVSSLNTARDFHTATLLPNGCVLVVAGIANTGATNTAELYDPTVNPITATWTATSSTGTINLENHTSTLLPNGKVLVAGGVNSTFGSLTNTELYDPVVGAWATNNSMNTPRSYHTATLLPTGEVLVAGGQTQFLGTPTNSTELFDPTAGTWTNTGAMTTKRALHTATLLADGKVLAAGGYIGTTLSSAELYDPTAGVWTTTGSLNTARGGHTATLLPDGRVLVAGGETNSTILSSAELYNPSTGIWTATGSLNTARIGHTATLLPDGNVLVAGGLTTTNTILGSAELFNPANGTWTLTGSLNTARESQTATLLPNGKVLVAGGEGAGPGFAHLASVELYDPAKGLWTTTTSMTTNRLSGTATLLGNGKVLATGGDPSFITSAEIYDAGVGFSPSWQPQITTFTSPLSAGGSLTLGGSLFRGISEASGGNGNQDSPSDIPMVQLRSIDGGLTTLLLPTTWSATSYVSAQITNFPVGYALVTMFVNGIPSASSILDVTSPIATVTLSNLVQYFDTTAKSVSVTTVPPGLSVTVTYNSSTAAPTNTGSYTVVATVNDAVYQGSATNTLQIELVRNFGVDVSHFQDASGIPETNWTQMYAQGRKFAFVKASEGLTGPDDAAMATNVANALQVGLLVGVYHFAHPENRPTTNGAVQEADHFLTYAGSNIGPGMLRPVLDWESTTGSVTSNTDWVLAFSQEIVNNRGAGAEPIVYCTGSVFDSRLANFALWLRDYTTNDPATFNIGPPVGAFANWAFIQYTDGPVGGLSDVDENVCHDDFAPLSSYLTPSAAPGFQLGNLSVNSGGFHLSFTNVSGTHFTLVSATNVSLALSNWMAVGTFTETSPGQFEFTDPQATNFPKRFYRVRSP